MCVCVRACASNKPSERLFTQVFAWSGVVEDAVGEGGRLPTRRALPRGVTNITQIHKIIKIHKIVKIHKSTKLSICVRVNYGWGGGWEISA